MNDLQFLWSARERPAFGSKRWLVVWAKRALQFRSLLTIVRHRRRLRARGMEIGLLSVIDSKDLKGPGSNFSIGDRTFIAHNAELVALEKISIGSRVVINDRVTVLTGSHHVGDPTWRQFRKPVRIEDYAWIAVGATILPGVTIGYGAVVGAGAVVAKDVPPLAVATGNPATVRLNVRPHDLDYDPVIFLAPYEAWVGRSKGALVTAADAFPPGGPAPAGSEKLTP
ncbi:acyltransferase [Variovorax sp. YR216]|uniref:acyltransferase n=1 Tax=Variovorax sp. YR216 TaxID=1882828 RepID=UPI00089AC00D|nr:acyltransferase [Variovorax sp. YR216]SEA34037.1 Acetyltransferase (isoleucine patch superfamily) [Variovorax sp. YR216]